MNWLFANVNELDYEDGPLEALVVKYGDKIVRCHLDGIGVMVVPIDRSIGSFDLLMAAKEILRRKTENTCNTEKTVI